MTLNSEVRRVTIRDVAAEANVSISTVSLFIRGRSGVSEATAQRVSAAIDKLNYVPRQRANREPESKFFGFLIDRMPMPAFSDIFYGEIIRALEAKAKAYGYGIVFAISEAGQLPRMVTEKQIRGLLILGGSPTNDDLAIELAQRDMPLVLVDNYVPGLQVDSIIPDNEWGGYAAFKHLVDLGHEKIAIIEGPRRYRTLTDRLTGALRAAEDSSLILPAEYRQASLSSGRSIKGYLEMKQLLALSNPPTAVFAISDKTAIGALGAIKEAGLKVPDDISMVGFDNVADTEPPLTTINVPKYEIGILAMQRLIEIVNGKVDMPVRTCVYTNLVIRGSTAHPGTDL